ncbi:MAG: thioredoxin family protein [Parachlamydiaceae bacterium]|nr:thioredoxin family protein [Parachlamydiaceae bacterium]
MLIISAVCPAVPLISQETDTVRVELIHEQETIVPGQPFWVAIRMQLADTWHTYWKNPGDVGMATSVEWDLPEGFTASPVMWPTPDKFSVDGIVGYGYSDEVILLSKITPTATLTQKEVPLNAEIRWLVCSDSLCVPGSGQVSATVPVSATSPQINERRVADFARARAELPVEQHGLHAHSKDDQIEIHMELPQSQVGAWSDVYFCPDDKQMIDNKIEATLKPSGQSPNHYSVILKSSAQRATDAVLKGVLVVSTSPAADAPWHAIEVDTLLDGSLISMSEETPTPFIHSAASSGFDGGLGLALLLAFVGGMILNLMPCVLPVISFKILSFVKLAGESRALVLKHGFAFFWGVMASFWVLAGILLGLKAYGHVVGWGFQLQEPLFVAGLAALLLVFGLSLFGLFEMNAVGTSLAGKVSTKNQGLGSSFLSGVLATAVATPCTGPFLGSAVGFALTVSMSEALLIFTFLGLGMALPYLLLAACPSLLRFLPKPGPWMNTFKELMGFIMIATVLWLLWVFSAQTGGLAVIILLISFFFISIGCWIYGKWASPVSGKRSRIISSVAALLCVLAGGYAMLISTAPWVALLDQRTPAMISDTAQATVWEDFSPERVAELRSQGIPVLIDFTAKWCLICQVNHLVLNSDSVNQKAEEKGVVRMKADWTKNDPKITEELRKHGRSGVPLYVLYGEDPTQPAQILPQVLTPDIVVQHLSALEK